MKFELTEMAVVLDSGDSEELCGFYAEMLGWLRIPSNPGDEWLVLVKDNGFALVFQQVEDYRPPVWPDAEDQQRQMMHLDFYVENPEAAIEHALACGARLSEVQFGDFWKVLIDPAGHPFCILPKREG